MPAHPPMVISVACRTPKAASPGRRPISLTRSNAHSDARSTYKHYGRRKGPKLSVYQAGLLDTLLPRLTLTPQINTDPERYFAPAQVQEVWLEVGFGAG